MSQLVPLFPVEPRLEDVILGALTAARDASREHGPACAVCGAEAEACEVERGIIELTCTECGSVLTEAHDEPVALSLAS